MDSVLCADSYQGGGGLRTAPQDSPSHCKSRTCDRRLSRCSALFYHVPVAMGSFKFRIKYRADIISFTVDTVLTEAYQSLGTYVTNVTKVTVEQKGVTLHETITLKAPDLLFYYAFGQAKTAHEVMLKRIKHFVERAQIQHKNRKIGDRIIEKKSPGGPFK